MNPYQSQIRMGWMGVSSLLTSPAKFFKFKTWLFRSIRRSSHSSTSHSPCDSLILQDLMISTPPEIKKFIGCLLLLILANIAVYFNSLKGTFQFDDLPLIQSQWVADLDAFDRQVRFSAFENRPVVLWTYALNNTLGKNRVFGFHLFNLAVHIGVTLLIFFTISRTQYLTAGKDFSWRNEPLANLPLLSHATPWGAEG